MAQPPLLQTGIGVVAPYDFALDRELWRWAPDAEAVFLSCTNLPTYDVIAKLEAASGVAVCLVIVRWLKDSCHG